MNLTAEQLLNIAGIKSTDTLTTRLNESATPLAEADDGGGMKTFEVIEFNSRNGSFDTETVQATNPVDAVMEYFGEPDDADMRAALTRDIKQNHSGGWRMMNDEDGYIIREM